MKLYEFQGKELFREAGIPVPHGKLITKEEELGLVEFPAVLKAQVLVGGRGKAGGIKICKTPEEGREAFKSLLGASIKGEKICALLAEETADIKREFYLSITIPSGSKSFLLMGSATGGVEIEQVAQSAPEALFSLLIDPIVGVMDYQVRYVAKRFACEVEEARKVLTGLYRALRENDATLVEINPLAETPKGLLALDAKVVLDDKARWRRSELFERLAEQQAAIGGQAVNISTDTITYVPLDGTVGLISDGAGTGMLTLDLISDAGAKAACFCEMGGLTSPEVMYSALERTLNNKNVKAIIVVLIGGFNRMDEMAEGIVRYQKEKGLPVPIVVRMCGTMEEEGKRIMREANLKTYDDLYEAVREVVALAGRNS